MEQMKNIINQMIPITEKEWNGFISHCSKKTFKKKQIISQPGSVCLNTMFINKGILRFYVTDLDGNVHTTHFSLENEFTGDYTSFLLKSPTVYTMQALENMEVISIPNDAIQWGYDNMKYGEKLGRLIAESYFVFMDNRINNTYIKTPKERYDGITSIYPNIHNRVPQHMIASYIGVSPIHLSRLKRKA